jgi:two-component system alkaline phosphatase synthesis response regulator PhoP
MADFDKKVLVVEDDKDFLWILKQGLVGKGFSVVFAQDGEEGLKMAEEEKPDLILLDILMPKLDGVAMAEGLKTRGIKSKIIFLTNLKGKLPVVTGLVEENDYIVKADLHIDQIVAKIKDKLGIK